MDSVTITTVITVKLTPSFKIKINIRDNFTRDHNE